MADDKTQASSSNGLGELDSFNKAALKAVSVACKLSNGLPSEDKADHDYYSSFAGFRTVMDACTARIESVMGAVCKHNEIKSVHNFAGIKTEQDMMEFLQDFNDQMLEKANINLDEASGIKSKLAGKTNLLVEVSKSGLARISGSWNKQMGNKEGSSHQAPIKLLAAKHVVRPQMQFKDLVNNSRNCFVPRITEKPHNKKPLSVLIEHSEDGSTEFYSHPYLFELDHFTTPNWLLIAAAPKAPVHSKKRPLVYIATTKELKAMVEELRHEKYLGLDVEAHSYRSYLGISCLIQLSAATVGKDYVIDPFPIWADMPILNEVLANPGCLKIMHGSGPSDIVWLQRDFSLYFVNVFDTYLAAKTLGFPRGCLSLKFLLGKYCNVHLDKKYQLADWRIRPLSQEMLDYAMEDVKHLPELFQKMKHELVSKSNTNLNLLRSVYDASNDL